MERLKQVSVFLENKVGTLATTCETLAHAGVNIEALWLTASGDYGITRLVVSDVEKATTALKTNGYNYHVTDVVGVWVENKPGVSAEWARKLANAKVNIEGAYCTGAEEGKKCLLVFVVSDVGKALTVS